MLVLGFSWLSVVVCSSARLSVSCASVVSLISVCNVSWLSLNSSIGWFCVGEVFVFRVILCSPAV